MAYIGSGAAPKATAVDNNAVGTNAIQNGAVTSPKVSLTKSDVGLSNVANVDQTNAANLTSGTVATARLGSGTANSTTYLRGDQTWAAAGGAPSTADVLNATAGASVGAVGTYAFLGTVTNTTTNVGGTLAGSSLTYVGLGLSNYSTGTTTAQANGSSGTPSGTWRCMGYSFFDASTGAKGVTVWLRIS